MTELPHNWKIRWIVQVALLLVLGEITYLNSLDGSFTFDDTSNIVKRPEIRTLWPPEWFRGKRWFGLLTLAVNYRWGGFEPFGYHVFNITVHLAAGLVLFGLVGRTLRLPRFEGQYNNSADWLGFATAAIWLVHPLNTQAVTYVIQRFESLMGLCFLLLSYHDLLNAV